MLQSRKSKTSSKCLGSLKEIQSDYLQKDVESLTLSLEHEKREASYLDEQIKLLQFELSSVPAPGNSSLHSLKTLIPVIEKKLEIEKKNLNNAKLQNMQLRQQINEHRLERSAQKQAISMIRNNLEKAIKETEAQTDELTKKNEEELDQVGKIVNLRSKSASQRSQFDEKISTLASFIRNSKQKSGFNFEEKSYISQGIEILSILKNVLKKTEGITHENKRKLDAYIKYVHILQNCFETIISATGMSKVDDIVTSFIKSEEQNQSVLQYFNNLNSEIDVLEEALRLSNKKISTIEGLRHEGKLNARKIIEKYESENKDLEKKFRSKEKKLKNVQEKVKELVPIVTKIYKLLEKMNLRGYLREEIDVDGIDNLSQENANLLLGQIEEYINYLLLISAKNVKKPYILNGYTKYDRRKSQSNKRFIIKDIYDSIDLVEDQDLEEARVPISLAEMKEKAKIMMEKRNSFLKNRSNGAEL